MVFVPNHQTITCEAAATVVQACIVKAEALSLTVCASVVDASGVLTAFLRMPGAPFHSADIATDKAYTAASFKVATGQLGELMKQHSEAVQSGVVLRPRVILFGGGIPLMSGDSCIGAVGVSGASEAEDIQCAEHGCEALRSIAGRNQDSA